MFSAIQATAVLSIKQNSLEVKQHQEPQDRILSRGLIVASTACAVLSLIPPLRLAGAIALRSVAILSSLEATMNNWSCSNPLGKGILIGHSVVAVAGLIAVAATLPFFVLASLIGDTVLKIFELINAIFTDEPRAMVKPVACLLINGFMLAGILACSWPLIVTAAAISATAMLILTILRGCNSEKNEWNSVHAICYGILAGIGIAAAITSAEISSTEYQAKRYVVKNNSEYEMRVYDPNKNLVATLAPGQEITLDLPGIPDYYPIRDNLLAIYDGPEHSHEIRMSEGILPITTIHNEALPVPLYPTLPIANAVSLTDTYEDTTEELNKEFQATIKEADDDNIGDCLQEATRLLKKGVTDFDNAPRKLLEHIIRTGICTEWHVKILQYAMDRDYELSSRHRGNEIPTLLDIHARKIINERSDPSSHMHFKQLIVLFFWYEQYRGLEPFKFEDVYEIKALMAQSNGTFEPQDLSPTNSILQTTGIYAQEVMRKIVHLVEEYDLENARKEVIKNYRDGIINLIGDLGSYNSKINVNGIIADYIIQG